MSLEQPFAGAFPRMCAALKQLRTDPTRPGSVPPPRQWTWDQFATVVKAAEADGFMPQMTASVKAKAREYFRRKQSTAEFFDSLARETEPVKGAVQEWLDRETEAML